MSTKAPPEKSMVAIRVSTIYIDRLTDLWQDPSSPIWTFIHAKKLSEQAASVKKITLKIKEADNIEPVIDVLVDAYLHCPPKYQIKRALASCLQNVSTAQPCVEEVMRRHIGQCLQGPGPLTPLPACRTVIDNCNSLLENFALGERCLQSLLHEAMSFLCDTLTRFYKETRVINTPVPLSEAMHNCHVTIQVLNKLVARSEKYFGRKSGERADDLFSVLIKCLDMAWRILLDAAFMVDCRASCGMTIPLGFKIMYKEDVVQKVVMDLFPGSEAARLQCVVGGTCPETLPNWAALGEQRLATWPTTRVCVASGCLAMLDAPHLAAEASPGQSLLCGVIGKQLIELIKIMDDLNGKVLLSRTLVLWTVQAVETFEALDGGSEALLRVSLRGNGFMLTALMEYAWTHWEDPTDVIRHQARLIFNNLLRCHLVVTEEEPAQSAFLLDLLASLLSTGWQHRGRYGPLCCLVGHLGAGVILAHSPRLPHHLLGAMGDQTLAGYISELYEKLYSAHRRELSRAAGDPVVNMTSWLTKWVDPVLDALCDGGKLQKTHVIEYILPKLLKHSPDTLHYMMGKLTEDDRVGPKVGALVTCLKRAKMSGLLQTVPLEQATQSAWSKAMHTASNKEWNSATQCTQNNDFESTLQCVSNNDINSSIQCTPNNDPNSALWYGVVSLDVIKKLLCHQNEQLRLDALGLVVEHPKTTEPLSEADLQLVMFFLPHNATSQEPFFRQHLAAILKKLFVRLRDGAQVLRRKVKSGNDQAKNDVTRYQVFVQWFVQQQFLSLYPGASFPCRTMALSALSTFTSIMSETATTNHKEVCEFALSTYITPPQAQSLIECLADSFELNKIDSYKILTSLPHDKLYLQSPERLEALFRTALALASSARPQDSSTAAYLFRVLLTQPHLHRVASRLLERHDDVMDTGLDAADVSERHLVVVQVLVVQLGRQLEVACRSLVHAAATEPMYPTLHCIRYLLNDTDLRCQSTSVVWRSLVRAVMDICFQVALVVSPVVSNSSPEGNVPVDSGLLGRGVLEAGRPGGLRGEADSARTVSLIPEYLVVCCWRSIKECSLLLGQLTLTAPLTDPHGDPAVGLLSAHQLQGLGDYFTTQLLESRHRGAFELAYAGFVKMTEMLWNCPFADVQALPGQWLHEILADVKSREPGNRLCATRRSAGVPFYVQAIVSAEPAVTGRPCFRHLMTELLSLAMPAHTPTPATADPTTPPATVYPTMPAHTTPPATVDPTMPADTTPPVEAGPTMLAHTPSPAAADPTMPAHITPPATVDPTMPTHTTPPAAADPTMLAHTTPPASEETAMPAHNTPPATEDPAQVHALNVLRALYRDTRLGEDVFAYIPDGLKAAILGYGSQLWGIRNSATLLFGALMTRIFGVKRSKDEMSKKNCLTGRVFFQRFPALYQFLLDQMAVGTSNIGSGGVYELHPGLYPVLMVLARLYPSVVEGANSTLNSAAFVPYIIRCASSPVYKTRLMAARAIRPLVGKDTIIATVSSLLECLPETPEGATSQNMLHGVLLQVTALTQTVGELLGAEAAQYLRTLGRPLEVRLWVLTERNPCLVTRKAFAELCFTVLTLEDSLSAGSSCLAPLRGAVCRQALSELFTSASPCPVTPELAEYHQALTHRLLTQVAAEQQAPTPGGATGQATGTPAEAPGSSTADLVHLVVRLLRCAEYEVRAECLAFLHEVLLDTDPDRQVTCDGFQRHHQIKEHAQKVLGLNECVHCQLITMALYETHTDCLVKALELLCRHPLTHTAPWTDATHATYSPLTVMTRLEEYKNHSSDEVRCCAHELSACLLPHLYTQATQGSTEAQRVLLRWCAELEGRCSSQESVSCREATACSLLQGGRSLLEDPRDLLGPVGYEVWTALIRLLQDEDVDVRQIAARIVDDVTSTDDSDHTDGSCFAPQPVVAVRCAVERLVALRADRDWRGLFDCLLAWVTRDVEPEWAGQEEKEVRLFDKGDLNTYRDELVFVRLVADQLTTFLQHSANDCHSLSCSSFTNGDHEDQCPDMYMAPNAKAVMVKLRQSLVKTRLHQLLKTLSVKVAEMNFITAKTPFLMTSQYQEDIVGLCRLKLATDCLLSVSMENGESDQLKTVTCDLKNKFSPVDAQENALLTAIWY